jgi:hypothetical protein
MYRADLQKFIKAIPFKCLTTTAVDRLHGLCLHVEADVDSSNALRFLDFGLVRFLRGAGGALPLIVFDELRGDDSKLLLEEASSHPLEDVDLDRCLGVLKGVAIYITSLDPCSSLSTLSSSKLAEGKVLWTLSEDQFSDGNASEKPDVSRAAAVIYIDQFREAVAAMSRVGLGPGRLADSDDAEAHCGATSVETTRMDDSAVEDALTTSVRRLVGRGRLVAHEGTHAMRMHWNILQHLSRLQFTRNAGGDWCLELDDFKEKLATPPKLAGYVTGQKLDDPEFPADAGRVLEHSITGGKAIFERDLNVVVVLRRTASTAGQPDEQIKSACLGAGDVLAVYRDPSTLRAISRRL